MPVAGSEAQEDKAENPEIAGGKVAFALGGSGVGKGGVKERVKGEGVKGMFEDDMEGEKKAKKAKVEKNEGGNSALDKLMEEEERAKEKVNRKDYWLCEGIVVKVMSKKLKEKGYYMRKGVVKKVIDKYVGEIEMVDSKHVLRVDQAELETVIPQIGGLVRIVNGAYRGSKARLRSIVTDKYCAKVQIEKGVYDGRVIPAVDYEDISKIA